MFKYLSRVIPVVLLVLTGVVLVGWPAPSVLAVEGSPAPTVQPTETSDPAKVKARIEARKTELKTKLDAAQTARMKGRCKASQAIIAKSKTRSEEVQKRRLESYGKVQSKVESLVTKLTASGISTDEITAAQIKVGLTVEELKAAFTAYQLALDDAAAIDCVADPVGFKASLDAARKLHDDIGKSFAELRKTIASSLAPALANAKKQIKVSPNEEGR